MKKAASSEEVSLSPDELLMLAESIHKGASSLAETASQMKRHGESAATIPMVEIKNMLKDSLDHSIHQFLDELRESRSASLVKPGLRKKPAKKKGGKK